MRRRLPQEKKEQCAKTAQKLMCDILFDEYVLECVALGRIAPGDKVPVQNYWHEMGYDDVPLCGGQNLAGAYIDEQGYVRTKSLDTFILHFYNFRMSAVFGDTHALTDRFDKNHLIDFNADMRAYVKNCFPVFSEIVRTNVDVDAFDLLMVETSESISNGSYLSQKLLVDIYGKKVRLGKRVDKYFDLYSYKAPFVQALLMTNGSRKILMQDDTKSIAYQMALFATFMFGTKENKALFDAKCEKWLREKA